MGVYGLLGKTLGHSFSPQLHAYLADYEYRLFEKTEAELPDFLRGGGFDGLNVTIPYKQTVIPYCAALSPEAKKIGSVNTLLRRPDGSLYGDNTDAAGFRRMLEALGVSVGRKKALVLGSGGAAKTVRAVLRERGASPVVTISRSGADHYGNLDRHADARLIVNATPVGMYPETEARPVDLRLFPKCEAVLDLIYNPARTKLLLQAEALGIPCAGGLVMLTEQARRAAELFTGEEIPEEKAQRALRALALQTENVALIGMPGCGKSRVGRALAERLGRRFVDMDEEIVARAGKSIPDIFRFEGEAGFRARESAVLRDVSKESGLVIATGGGVVTREENRPLLHRNSRIVWLDRPIEGLSKEGRPLSLSRPIEELAAERLPLYRAWADEHVEMEATPEETAEKVLRVLRGGEEEK